jgi:4-amino-4-deoxy-L-arabinose transferase-like glycosyltransferase
MKAGMDDMLALRLWPFLFGVGTLLGTTLLAFLVAPRSPWTMTTATLLIAGSPALASNARMGLLETGMACFLVFALCAVFLAERDSRWWIAAGVLVGLGFLQKAPIALVTCALAVPLLCRHPAEGGYSWSALRRDRCFQIGTGIALGLCAFWPLVQLLRFGSKSLKVQFLWQMVYRFGPLPPPGARGAGPEPLRWLDWLRLDAPWIWLPCLALLLYALLAPRYRSNGKLLFISLYVFVVCGALALAGGEVYPRYIVVLVPFLAAVGGVVLTRLSPRPPLAALLAAVLLASNAGRLAKIDLSPIDTDEDRIAAAELFRAKLAENETAVFFASLDRSRGYPPPAFLYYADLDRRVIIFDRRGLEQLGRARVRERLRPPHQGIVHEEDFPVALQYLGPLVEVGRHGEHVIWKTDGRKAPSPNPHMQEK